MDIPTRRAGKTPPPKINHVQNSSSLKKSLPKLYKAKRAIAPKRSVAMVTLENATRVKFIPNM